MLRFRWTEFRLDTARNILDGANTPPALKKQLIEENRGFVLALHGESGLDDKLSRWSSIRPPDVSSVTRYDDLLQEIESSFIHGDFYPALTGAVCLGERILNHLVIELRDRFSDRASYKRVYRKDQFDDWKVPVAVLHDWSVIDTDLRNRFAALERLRNPSVHFGNMGERQTQSREALQLVFDITTTMFGIKHERFFWCPGEVYVKKSWERDALTNAFVLEGCLPVGPFHRIENKGNQLVVIDDYAYSQIEITDDEFCALRQAWQDTGKYPVVTEVLSRLRGV